MLVQISSFGCICFVSQPTLLDVTKRSTTRRHGVRRQPKANQTHEIVAPRLQIARGERHAHPPAASPMRARAPPIFPPSTPPECNLSITRSPTRALLSPHRSSSTHGTRPPSSRPFRPSPRRRQSFHAVPPAGLQSIGQLRTLCGSTASTTASTSKSQGYPPSRRRFGSSRRCISSIK